MAEGLEKQIIRRLKRINCQQPFCRNNNQDNIDLIVFGKQNSKRSGLMCSECLIDEQLLQQITPVQKHSISIRKFMKTLTQKYLEYSDQKNSVNWGPNILEVQKTQIKQMISKYEQILFKGTLQVVKFIENLQNQTLQQIRNLHKDISFQKLVELLNEEDEQVQSKINVSNQLKNITSNLMLVQGQCKLSNQNEIKQKHDAILYKYRKSMQMAKKCIENLIQVQKRTLKQLLNK